MSRSNINAKLREVFADEIYHAAQVREEVAEMDPDVDEPFELEESEPMTRDTPEFRMIEALVDGWPERCDYQTGSYTKCGAPAMWEYRVRHWCDPHHREMNEGRTHATEIHGAQSVRDAIRYLDEERRKPVKRAPPTQPTLKESTEDWLSILADLAESRNEMHIAQMLRILQSGEKLPVYVISDPQSHIPSNAPQWLHEMHNSVRSVHLSEAMAKYNARARGTVKRLDLDLKERDPFTVDGCTLGTKEPRCTCDRYGEEAFAHRSSCPAYPQPAISVREK